ncbi:methyltransferase domain-containing protein [Nocardiopsis aegyptia]|uniref:methyltransferase domain-containing protein n=1 Tax=Nocardiopsis aegyptia TaxID=220378 RepID=UPI00366EB29C
MGKTLGMDYAPLARALAEQVRAAGTPDHIASLFHRVPRHRFLPDVMWGEDRTRYDRAADFEGWLRAAYSDEAMTTQLDDGAEGGMGLPTSSSSAPSVVARMLTAARIEPGHKVLEVGTGTGWAAALLAELLGSRNVATVEIDTDVALRARTALHTAGYAPEVIIGDGENPPMRPDAVHRVIATCQVARIPWAWLDLVRPRGLVVTPWSPTPGAPGGVLAVLERLGRGLGEGAFRGSLAFMWARGQRRPAGVRPGLGAAPDRTDHVEGDPREPWLDGETSLLLSLLVPDWRHGMGMEDGATEPHVWIASTRCGSWARYHADGRVEQGGRPRALAEEFRVGLDWWRARGEPGVDRWGLTVDRSTGRQTVWLDSPSAPLWSAHRPSGVSR